MTIIIEDTTVLDGQSNDIINNALLGNTPLVTYKTSPWNIEKLEQYKELNLPEAIVNTAGISFAEDGPQIIPRDEIIPVDWGQTKQVRVGTSLYYGYINDMMEGVGAGWVYSAKLPTVEKLKKPIKRADGGYYRYRVVDARHRFMATTEYKDFPCYVVEGHEADIDLLAQKLNNPTMHEKKKDNDDASVMATIQEQLEWFDKTKGKKGCGRDVKSIIVYLKDHFPQTAKKDRKKFADRCLSAVGILKDLEDLTKADIAKLLKEYHPDYTNSGNEDNKGRVGHSLRIGRNYEQHTAYIDMAQSQIKYSKKGEFPEQYFIASFTMGEGVTKQPTTENLDQKRTDARYGLWMKDFVEGLCVPITRMHDAGVLVEPKVKFIAQNNGKSESPDNLY